MVSNNSARKIKTKAKAFKLMGGGLEDRRRNNLTRMYSSISRPIIQYDKDIAPDFDSINR